MTHPEMNELYELYVLGILEPDLAAEIDQHVREGCEYCLERLRQASALAAGMAGIADPKTLPETLRARVVSAVGPQRRAYSETRTRGWLLATAALAVACAFLIALTVWSYGRMGDLRNQLHSLERERKELISTLEVLSRSDTRMIQFGLANAPHGRVFVNRSGGVVFVGSDLPPLPGDRTYELWLVPTAGAPRPAGLFRPNAAGESVDVAPIPVNPADAAVAVSVEPLQGSSAPTTKPFLVVPLG